MPVRGALVENGAMGRPHVPEGAAMDGHGRGPGGQRGCHHPADERARLVEQDADLHVRHAVQVEHDIAASPVDPARVQAVPHLTKKLPLQRGELLPRRRGGNDGGPAGLDISKAYLVVHPAIIALRSPHRHKRPRRSAGTKRLPSAH